MNYPDSSAIPNYGNFLKLTDRGFIVLGAGDGMGRQSCHALAQAGARVLCVDRDPELAQSIARDVDGVPVGVDVTSRAGMSKVFAKVGVNVFDGKARIFERAFRHVGMQLGGGSIQRLSGGVFENACHVGLAGSTTHVCSCC